MALKRSSRLTLVGGTVAMVVGLAAFQLHFPVPRPSLSLVANAAAADNADARATLRSLSLGFQQVADAVKPTVASVRVVKNEGPEEMHGAQPYSFRYFGGGPRGFAPPRAVRGGGTGIVLSSDGDILTNNHVVSGASQITVRLSDGREFPAKVRGADPKTDVAVVHIDAKGLSAAKFGDSDKAKVGEWVVAVGHPFGLDHTVTVGVVSALDRSGLGSGPYEDFIQTDASINPGNSGGPLLNLDGEVIGVNSMIAGMGTGIGFAIPSNMALKVAKELVASGSVHRPWLGVSVQDVTPQLAPQLPGTDGKGALVSQIMPDSPAEKAKLAPGDVIVEVNGNRVDGARALVRAVLDRKVGERVDLGYVRDGKSYKASVNTVMLPTDAEGESQGSGESGTPHRYGMSLQSLTPDLAQHLGVEAQDGVMVAAVGPGSAADQAGVQAGDVIAQIDRKPVRDAAQAKVSLSKGKGSHLLLLKRGEGSVFVVLSALD